jgi:hypothetical protein
MSYLRFIVADQQELDMLLLSSEHRQIVASTMTNSNSLSARSIGSFGGFRTLRNAQHPYSLKNEILMFKLFLQYIVNMLAAYPTTFAQDVSLLSRDPSTDPHAPLMFSNQRNALIQIKGEKEILMFYKDFADTALSVLQTWPVEQVYNPDFHDKMNCIQDNKHFIIHNYCRTVAQRLLLEEKRKNDQRARNVNMALPTVV